MLGESWGLRIPTRIALGGGGLWLPSQESLAAMSVGRWAAHWEWGRAEPSPASSRCCWAQQQSPPPVGGPHSLQESCSVLVTDQAPRRPHLGWVLRPDHQCGYSLLFGALRMGEIGNRG